MPDMTFRGRFLSLATNPKILVLGMSAMIMAGCQTGVAQRYPANMGTIDSQYAHYLGAEYSRLNGLLTANNMEESGQRFMQKATQATYGEWIPPEIPPQDRLDLSKAYTSLMAGLFAAMDPQNAPFLAKAQVNYDCWVLVGSEECHSHYLKAMNSIDTPKSATKTETIYFAAQSSELTEEAREKLASLAMAVRMNKTLSVRLIGSADRKARNPSLALRRAIAVRNVLSQMGVALDRMSVKDEVQTDTILSQQGPETAGSDGDRRVDIILEQVIGQSI